MGGLLSMFGGQKPPVINVPPAPPAKDTTEELKRKQQVRQASLLRYLGSGSQTGIDVLRSGSTRTGLNP